MDIYQRIIKNLKDRVYPINLAGTLHGIDDWAEGLAALQVLVDNGQVLVEHPLPGPSNHLPTYRLSWQATGRPEVRRSQMHVVDSTEKTGDN